MIKQVIIDYYVKIIGLLSILSVILVQDKFYKLRLREIDFFVIVVICIMILFYFLN